MSPQGGAEATGLGDEGLGVADMFSGRFMDARFLSYFILFIVS